MTSALTISRRSRIALAAALLFGALNAANDNPVLAQSYPPPPAPGYSYNIPYLGYPTYAAVANSTLAVAGDAYCIQGSATRDVRVVKIGISGTSTATNVTIITVNVILRSGPNTGPGTPVQVTPNDSISPAATAQVMSYNVAPTPGPAIGTIRAVNLMLGSQGNTTNVGAQLFQFTQQPLILRGPAQFACVNISAAGAGASLVIESEHVEVSPTQAH